MNRPGTLLSLSSDRQNAQKRRKWPKISRLSGTDYFIGSCNRYKGCGPMPSRIHAGSPRRKIIRILFWGKIKFSSVISCQLSPGCPLFKSITGPGNVLVPLNDPLRDLPSFDSTDTEKYKPYDINRIAHTFTRSSSFLLTY